MALHYTKTVDGKLVHVEERTYRVEVMTPKTADGVAGYTAVAYRERFETTDGVATTLVRLPPLRIPITKNLTATMSLISGTVDAVAMQAKTDATWPLDADGNLIPI